jgi:beta-glucanase (GH16 family)
MRYILFLQLLLLPYSCLAVDLCGPRIENTWQSPLAFLHKTSLSGGFTEEQKAKRWSLVWSDDFQKNGKPDPDKWKFEVGGHGFGTNDANYATDSIKNAHVKNGHLAIEARKEEYEDQHYTSARINSRASWTYGRFEFRAKMPTGRGTWPALWLLADKITYGNQLWPHNGEIDIAEMVGFDQNVNHVTVHTKKYNYIDQTEKTATRYVPDLDTQYHDYALEWLPGRIEIFFDGDKLLTYKKEPGEGWEQWPFDRDFHIIMNLTIGGNWGGMKGIDDHAFPAFLDVSSVKVYRPLLKEDCDGVAATGQNYSQESAMVDEVLSPRLPAIDQNRYTNHCNHDNHGRHRPITQNIIEQKCG